MSHPNHPHQVNHVNLIPASRRDAKRRRRHARWCAAGCAAYALGLAAACGTCMAFWRGADSLAGEVARVNAEIEHTNKMTALIRADAAAADSHLAATRAIAAQPDWSTLLALLSKNIKDDIVLRSCRLRNAVDAAGAEAKAAPAFDSRNGQGAGPQGQRSAAAPSGLVLSAAGLARTQPAVTQFVLRLEETGLFSRVKLIDTSREGFLTGDAIAFRLECSLDEPGGAKP